MGLLGCECCKVELCGTCCTKGSLLGDSGVFSDILTPELAEDLLAHKAWLSFKAQSYFLKADYDGDSVLDWAEIKHVSNRLFAEVGLSAPREKDLRKRIAKV